MKTSEVRAKYIEFFRKRDHAVIPSASLVPENDPTTLFTGSGMQPLVPYLLGAKHPAGTKLVNSQKSFRSGDIEDVGDNRHTTFFEMLGNWSLGAYFKAEQLPYFFEFLTGEIGLDPKRLYVSVFIGDEANGIPKDTESVAIWKQLFAGKGIEAKDIEIGTEENGGRLGIQGGRIFYYDAKKNWWSRSGVPANMPAGEPGGPDSEVFYEFTEIEHDKKFGEHCHPNCDCGRFLEIGNSVFMEYKKTEAGTFEKLPQRNVDFGGGLERIAAVSENNSDVFLIDVLKGTIQTLERLSGKQYQDAQYTSAFRVVADHLRSSIFLIGDGVFPGNSDQGYFVRRLLRRAVRYWDKLGITEAGLSTLVDPILSFYEDSYPGTFGKKEAIKEEIRKEEEKFRRTLSAGLKEFEKMVRNISSIGGVPIEGIKTIMGVPLDKVKSVSGTPLRKIMSGKDAFVLFSTYGFPVEVTVELMKERGLDVDVKEFEEEFKKHQELSRAGSEKKFKGGLGDTSEMSVKYHTATHMLHKALREVLGTHVLQRGSNITPERLRFDFSHTEKMTDEQKKKVEDLINENIAKDLPVSWEEIPFEEAKKRGALGLFEDKYEPMVKVYRVGTPEDTFSYEICGGPHVPHTGIMGTFKIQKEEAVSAGVRRIKAVLE